MHPIKCWQVDAFTNQPFSGNPAAVCWLEPDASGQTPATAWLQAVANEMNLSETAFVQPLESGFGLRWFTPQVEVELCGHATLAAAHVLWSTGRQPLPQDISFQTRSGTLTCSQGPGGITMDFPASPVTQVTPPDGLLEALGVTAEFVGRTQFDHLVVVEQADDVRGLQPDLHRLKKIPTRGVIVTATADDGRCDFVSRFFAPAVGVDEDPVTGSAHCGLGPYWSARLGKPDLVGYQASARGGTVSVQVRNQRVLLTGQAVTVLQGELLGNS